MKRVLQKIATAFAMFAAATLTVQADDVNVAYTMMNLPDPGVLQIGLDASSTVVDAGDPNAIVVIGGTSYRNDAHSLFNNPTVTFMADKKFSITIGGCLYENPNAVKVYVGGTLAATLDNTVGCYHNGTGNVAEWTYNTTPEEPVEVQITGMQYLPYFAVTFIDPVREQLLYSTTFDEWANASNGTSSVEKKTKYSHETLTFSWKNVLVSNTNINSDKFPAWEHGWMMCAKTSDTYIETTALADITKVEYIHGATGGNRGFKLYAKGDGDEEWVLINGDVASTAVGTTVTKEINKKNCQLRFENIKTDQNAYLMSLKIWGMVNMGQTPAFKTMTLNGVTRECADTYTEDNDGNMVATIKLSKSETFVDETENPIEFVIENGTPSPVTYETTGEGAEKKCVITAPVTVDAITVNYITTVILKPDYTLTYLWNNREITTQTVEEDAAIGSLPEFTETDIPEGSKYRGWFANPEGLNNRKITASDIVGGAMNIYAVCTPIEKQSVSDSYIYKLNTPYFYSEDHESFNPIGNASYHDTQHGWEIKDGAKIEILVGGNAYIMLGLCKYSNAEASVELVNAENNTVGSIEKTMVSTDGDLGSIQYTGPAGVLTLVFHNTNYLHELRIINTEENPIEPNENNVYVVAEGNAGHFLATLSIACANSKSIEGNTTIFLPDGLYDLGEETLTTISGKNISIIGESMENTIIRNTPPMEKEGIGTTATLFNTSKNLYMQDLTLENALDYYSAGSAGRAVCLQDKGTNTICKNVRMLSYQDTYYSNNASMFYWETSEIHGTVDFLCGDGDIIFNECDLVVEKRTAAGTGECTIAAPYNTPGVTDWGYVFLGCNIINHAASFNLGRAWDGKPTMAYLNTRFADDAASKIIAKRFKPEGMNVAAHKFFEYNSVGDDGVTVVSPSTNIITFTHSSGNNANFETILTDEAAADYTVANIFGAWTPDETCRQATSTKVTVTEGVAAWESESDLFLLYEDGELVGMTSEKSHTLNIPNADFTVRAANQRGGFGAAAGVGSPGTVGLKAATAKEIAKVEYFNLNGYKVAAPARGLNIVKTTYDDGSVCSKSVLCK